MRVVSFSEEQLHQLHEEVFQLMLKAGWLVRFTFTTDKGFHLVWSESGADRSKLLKAIVSAHRLVGHGDDHPLLFYKLAQGDRLARARFAFMPDEAVLALWRESVDAIALPIDEDHLLAFAGIMATWGLDRDE